MGVYALARRKNFDEQNAAARYACRLHLTDCLAAQGFSAGVELFAHLYGAFQIGNADCTVVEALVGKLDKLVHFGAKFDEFGNLKNWWTDSDLKAFEDLAQAMISQFDGLETEAGKVNGKLVVSENIADAGGLSCALEAAKEDPQADISAFFINWARIWGVKASLERQKLLLAIDVHAPHVLRANMQPKNLADFYTTFNIQPGDKMWLAPADRVNIW